jgi:hypothetical protein
MIPQPSDAQKRALVADRAAHRRWLAKHGIDETPRPVTENPYTGLLLAALLDPDARAAVVRGLLAGDPRAGSGRATRDVSAAQWPTGGVDLVVDLSGDPAATLLVEHKRFKSHSHRPGYRRDPQAAWQTDKIYRELQGLDSPRWLVASPSTDEWHLIVLDAYGKSMEQMFPNADFNDRWIVTSYAAFGAVLRAEHTDSTRGLVPLLAALYAGS